ncbi:hypothetical protein B9G54_07440 [Alloscardovia macacae]|uniref:HNH endonuclease n=1 Tax=Alloscardovia macacae TaxID=1160091 RepID=A0A1Y2SSK7_9BIFI|nr:hypothetical protein [Alloscardovia macacae]OTA25517.1 hypothetical protein B9G54_07440 [Alloscardovia macacae]OTA28084.1 hypothetical protein B9T39_07460 [Alloscardovia macacae]
MLTEDTIEKLRGLTMSKRARSALEIMLERGTVTTKVLQEEYGLDHPPRAIRDLKDAGVLVGSHRVKESGKTISEYFLEDVSAPSPGGAPRNPIKKADKDRIVAEFGGRCAVCGTASNRLQLDHRVPFAIAGDPPEWTGDTAMPLCPSDNRAKSWTCKHCENWTTRNPELCQRCMWCHPENYDHIAMKPERRLVVTAHDKAGVETLRWLEVHAAEQNKSSSEVAIQAIASYQELG